MNRRHATAIGFTAVLFWSLLALFTVGSNPVPPLMLNALCFTIATAVGLIWTSIAGGFSDLRRVSWKVFAFGAAGLFGYHLFYFTALRLAPAAEAGLIAYLWPLLIVLFSGLLPGERLRWQHIAGAVLAFVGAGLLVARGAAGFQADALPGYGFALLCALTWSGYSVLSRRLGSVPTSSVTVFCAIAAILSALAHLALEETVWPTDALTWTAIAALGLGPVGVAFFFWDIGVKKGDIQLLGVASYAAPLLSTVILILSGITPPTSTIFLAVILISGGAVLAAKANTTQDRRQ